MTKKEHHQKASLLTSTATVKSKHSLTPRQININLTPKVKLPQYLLANTSCLDFNKRLQSVLKDRKYSLEMQGKHQNQTQLEKIAWNYQT